ncbi:MAG: hypothetical protein ACYTGZ_20865 [Planctomycetota bacterium]|jgi:hypothetical protein
MSLDPFFSLTPRSPQYNGYNPSAPTEPYAYAYLYAYGVHTYSGSGLSLEEQHANDELMVAYNPVLDSNQTVAGYGDDVRRRSAVLVSLRGINVSTVNQYLLVFRLAKRIGSPIAQIFMGTQFVRAETLTASPYDDIAILVDVPGNEVWTFPIVRLATTTNEYRGFLFKGVDGYLL